MGKSRIVHGSRSKASHSTAFLSSTVSTLLTVLGVQRHAGETELRFYHSETEASTTVARGFGDILPHVTASPDGRTILFSRRDTAAQDLMLVENFR
jgi:hypothetical protein